MHLIEEPIPGLLVLQTTPRRDDRGTFCRCYCREELRQFGITKPVEQGNLSWNAQAATLRGMHMQKGPHAELKIVQCVKGSIFDAAVDLRPSSPARNRWYGTTLSAQNGRMMVVPEGFAHGFLTLAPDTLVHYLTTASYAPEAETGIRFDDPAIGIEWPCQPLVISARDAAHAYLQQDEPA